MDDVLRLEDEPIAAAAATLTQASERMITGNVGRPAGQLASLTGIDYEVGLHIRGLSVARAALADAADGVARILLAIVQESAEIDQEIAEQTSYSVRGYVP